MVIGMILQEPSPPQILDFQIDDIVRPRDFLGTEGRVRRTKAAMKAGPGFLGRWIWDEGKTREKHQGSLNGTLFGGIKLDANMYGEFEGISRKQWCKKCGFVIWFTSLYTSEN